MDKIAEKADITYQLYPTPDGKYGVPHENSSGMIGQVHNKHADFALADLTVTDFRKDLVQFTEPFMVVQLSALVQKANAQNLTTLEDLVQRNQQITKSDEQIGYGVIGTGSTIAQLAQTTDPIGKAIYDSIEANKPCSKFTTYLDGVDRVKETGNKFAMIGASSVAEYIARNNCALKVLPDNRTLHQRDFAIALQKGSNYLESFNKAIRELKSDGTIERLRQDYWANNCDKSTSK